MSKNIVLATICIFLHPQILILIQRNSPQSKVNSTISDCEYYLLKSERHVCVCPLIFIWTSRPARVSTLLQKHHGNPREAHTIYKH
jgi:hypothetical protein